MDKDEMIEEIEKEQPIAMMIQRYLDNNNIKVSNPLLPMHIEEMLNRKNYRQIADDEMVIKKSEYAKLCIVEYEAADETTREILRGVRKIVVGSGTWRQAYDILVSQLAKEKGIELE